MDELAAAELVEQDILGLGITVQLAEGPTLSSSAGRVGPDKHHAPYSAEDTVQVIGSITKMYTATLTLQLVEDGLLALDTSIDRWFEFGGASDISVRMLLNHTSGLNDYLELVDDDELGRVWLPEELASVATRAAPFAAPGGAIGYYSNTNYTLLALIIEAVTGMSWEETIDQRIVQQLGLAKTGYAGDPERRAELVGGWFERGEGWLDALDLVHPSVGWGAGALVATNAEVAEVTRALFAGELFSDPASLEAMLTFTAPLAAQELSPGEPPQTLGLGVIRYHAGGLEADGHVGHVLGYDAATFREPLSQTLITVTANTDHALSGFTALKVAQRFLE